MPLIYKLDFREKNLNLDQEEEHLSMGWCGNLGSSMVKNPRLAIWRSVVQIPVQVQIFSLEKLILPCTLLSWPYPSFTLRLALKCLFLSPIPLWIRIIISSSCHFKFIVSISSTISSCNSFCFYCIFIFILSHLHYFIFGYNYFHASLFICTCTFICVTNLGYYNYKSIVSIC